MILILIRDLRHRFLISLIILALLLLESMPFVYNYLLSHDHLSVRCVDRFILALLSIIINGFVINLVLKFTQIEVFSVITYTELSLLFAFG